MRVDEARMQVNDLGDLIDSRFQNYVVAYIAFEDFLLAASELFVMNLTERQELSGN
jgi:hypothetical protein